MSNPTRFSDWTDRLSTYVDRCRDERFKWGKHDCLLFAAGAVKALTGECVGDEWEGRYSTKREAAALIRELGFKSYRQAVTAKLGKSFHPALAQRGDIVMRGRSVLGVCLGKYSYFVGRERGHEGLVAWPTLDCTAAWA